MFSAAWGVVASCYELLFMIRTVRGTGPVTSQQQQQCRNLLGEDLVCYYFWVCVFPVLFWSLCPLSFQMSSLLWYGCCPWLLPRPDVFHLCLIIPFVFSQCVSFLLCQFVFVPRVCCEVFSSNMLDYCCLSITLKTLNYHCCVELCM